MNKLKANAGLRVLIFVAAAAAVALPLSASAQVQYYRPSVEAAEAVRESWRFSRNVPGCQEALIDLGRTKAPENDPFLLKGADKNIYSAANITTFNYAFAPEKLVKAARFCGDTGRPLDANIRMLMIDTRPDAYDDGFFGPDVWYEVAEKVCAYRQAGYEQRVRKLTQAIASLDVIPDDIWYQYHAITTLTDRGYCEIELTSQEQEAREELEEAMTQLAKRGVQNHPEYKHFAVGMTYDVIEAQKGVGTFFAEKCPAFIQKFDRLNAEFDRYYPHELPKGYYDVYSALDFGCRDEETWRQYQDIVERRRRQQASSPQ